MPLYYLLLPPIPKFFNVFIEEWLFIFTLLAVKIDSTFGKMSNNITYFHAPWNWKTWISIVLYVYLFIALNPRWSNKDRQARLLHYYILFFFSKFAKINKETNTKSHQALRLYFIFWPMFFLSSPSGYVITGLLTK